MTVQRPPSRVIRSAGLVFYRGYPRGAPTVSKEATESASTAVHRGSPVLR